VSHAKNYPDDQLSLYLRQSQVWAFEEIYRRYWSKLYGFAYHQIGVKEEAEQMVHDVFELLWNRRNTVEINHLGVYLMVATKHTVNKFIRSQITFRKYQEHLILQQMHQNEADEPVQFGELSRAVEEALRQLPEKTALVFRLSRLERQSHREIAAKLNLSEKAVEYHVTKSLRHLKQHLKPYLSDN
jgi:RNA polymerase sigma-70 factor (ECF subfamily)